MSGIIQAEDIKFSYTNNENEIRFALNGVTLEVSEGEFIVILGHNGSGKSTFAKHINALELPSSGEMWVCGKDTRREENLWDIRQNAGMVFQNPDNQLVATVVEEDVAFGPENLGIESSEIVKIVNQSLEKVNMLPYKKRPPHMLSGGQKQRIAIAGILAMEPKIIVFDEPTAMLDPRGRQEVMQTILKLNREEKKTVVLITHFMEEAVQADRVVVMKAGVIKKVGTPSEIFSQTQLLRECELVPPAATQIYEMLAQEGVQLPSCPITSEELVEELCQLL